MYCSSFDDRTMVETDIASRQRLRPWLIAKIDSGNIPGLEWLNAEKTKFKIPWKHAGKQGWDPSCSQIFTVRRSTYNFPDCCQLKAERTVGQWSNGSAGPCLQSPYNKIIFF